MHEASRGPEKGAVTAQKALKRVRNQEKEVDGGNEKAQDPPQQGVRDFHTGQINDVVPKKQNG